MNTAVKRTKQDVVPKTFTSKKANVIEWNDIECKLAVQNEMD